MTDNANDHSLVCRDCGISTFVTYLCPECFAKRAAVTGGENAVLKALSAELLADGIDADGSIEQEKRQQEWEAWKAGKAPVKARKR